MATFPAAGACVELMLADKKDGVYEAEIKNLLRELLERSFGTHFLSQLLPELTSVSALLYYLLVLGKNKPQQTLGEEYCDVMRVVSDADSVTKVPVVKNVAFLRHIAWLAIAVLPRYLSSRSKTGWLNLSQLTWSPRERMAQQLRQRQAVAGMNGDQSSSTDIQQPVESKARSLLTSVDLLVAELKAFAAAVETKLIPGGYEFALAPLQEWLSQLHLAAFYVSARFLHIAKRLTGIEYIFVRKDLQPALNLSLLGYLMCIRLVSTAVGELRLLRKMRKAEAKQKLGGTVASHNGGPTARVPTALVSCIEMAVKDSKMKPKKCALCLGERSSPATTPCGHVFCWECIVGWCQKNKPECPICRQESHPQQIKCIYNYN